MVILGNIPTHGLLPSVYLGLLTKELKIGLSLGLIVFICQGSQDISKDPTTSFFFLFFFFSIL